MLPDRVEEQAVTTPALRRQSDRALADFDKRLALLEQARELDARSRDAHFRAIEQSISALGTKIDTALTTMVTQSAEPSASPAGRAVLSRLADLTTTVDAHDDFVQQVTGALRMARFALGTSFLSAIGTVVLAVTMLAAR